MVLGLITQHTEIISTVITNLTLQLQGNTYFQVSAQALPPQLLPNLLLSSVLTTFIQ